MMHTYKRIGTGAQLLLVSLVLSIAQLSNVYRQQLSRTGTETDRGAAPFDGLCESNERNKDFQQ